MEDRTYNDLIIRECYNDRKQNTNQITEKIDEKTTITEKEIRESLSKTVDERWKSHRTPPLD